MNQEGFW